MIPTSFVLYNTKLASIEQETRVAIATREDIVEKLTEEREFKQQLLDKYNQLESRIRTVKSHPYWTRKTKTHASIFKEPVLSAATVASRLDTGGDQAPTNRGPVKKRNQRFRSLRKILGIRNTRGFLERNESKIAKREMWHRRSKLSMSANSIIHNTGHNREPVAIGKGRDGSFSSYRGDEKKRSDSQRANRDMQQRKVDQIEHMYETIEEFDNVFQQATDVLRSIATPPTEESTAPTPPPQRTTSGRSANREMDNSELIRALDVYTHNPDRGQIEWLIANDHRVSKVVQGVLEVHRFEMRRFISMRQNDINQRRQALSAGIKSIEEAIADTKKELNKLRHTDATTEFIMEALDYTRAHDLIVRRYDDERKAFFSEQRALGIHKGVPVDQLRQIVQCCEYRLHTLNIKFMYKFLPERLNPDETERYNSHCEEMSDPMRIDTCIDDLEVLSRWHCQKCHNPTMNQMGSESWMYRCSECGHLEDRGLDNTIAHFRFDEINFHNDKKSPSNYYRINHFRERLHNLFGKNAKHVRPEILDAIEKHIATQDQDTMHDRGTTFRKSITNLVMRGILETLQNTCPKLKFNSCYDISTQLARYFNPDYAVPVLTSSREHVINEAFVQIEKAFDACRFKNCQNIFPVTFLWFKIFSHFNFTDYLPLVSHLKGRDLLQKHERNWENVASILGWAPVPIVGNMNIDYATDTTA